MTDPREEAPENGGETCADCSLCAVPDMTWENPERMGWCRLYADFVGLDDEAQDCYE